MSLHDRIEEDLKTSLKGGAKERALTLRMLKAAVHNEMIAQKTKTDDDTLIQTVIKREIKKRKEASDAYQQAGRQELADKENMEMKILNEYMPQPLTEAEIRKVITTTIDGLPASQRNFGLVMKTVMATLGVQADGQTVAALTKELLS